MDVTMDNYLVIAIMLNFKDFLLFIPLNVFNDIVLCFDIFIQLRANQRLATEYLLNYTSNLGSKRNFMLPTPFEIKSTEFWRYTLSRSCCSLLF